MKILVAEDEELLRLLLADFISELGHEVSSVVNGRELLALALRERPDLIVTDLDMPEMSGGAIIAMLDVYPELAAIPVVVISGASPAVIADMGIPKEIPVLPKPFDFGMIAREIARFGAGAVS